MQGRRLRAHPRPLHSRQRRVRLCVVAALPHNALQHTASADINGEGIPLAPPSCQTSAASAREGCKHVHAASKPAGPNTVASAVSQPAPQPTCIMRAAAASSSFWKRSAACRRR